MTALLFTLFVAAAPTPALENALQKALQRSPARVELISWDAPRCLGEFIPAPFDASGRVAVKVRGARCEAWGWAQVRVLVTVASLTRDLKEGEPLAGAWVGKETEFKGGVVLSEVPAGATASHALRQGGALSFGDVRVGPKPGTSITVRVVLGALSLEQRGTISPCNGAETCATLPSGKRVAGLFSDGVLLVKEAP